MMSEKRKVTVDGEDFEVKIEREGGLWKVEVGGKEFSITLDGDSGQGRPQGNREGVGRGLSRALFLLPYLEKSYQLANLSGKW